MDEFKKQINKDIEIQLLTNSAECNASDVSFSIKSILTGHYDDALTYTLSSMLIDSLSHGDNIQEIINDNIQAEVEMHDSWLCMGIASLLYFIQCNWTGPPVNEDNNWLHIKREEALRYLSLHDECNENVKKPELLYFSKIIFSNEYMQKSYQSCLWWLIRVNLLHQFVLEESSGTIFEETEKIISMINDLNILKNPFCKTLFNLEIAQFYFYYRRTQESEKYLEHAQHIAKLTMDLQGAMGKRTKHQQEEKAQLYLKINVEKEPFPSRCCENVPVSIDLNDDLRLERIEFSECQERVKLGATEEAILLARHTQLQLSQPKDKLTEEEIQSYVMNVIEYTKNWSLKMTSLCYRCSYESNDKRTVERAMLQIEYLLKEINDSKVPVTERIDMFFTSGMKPLWMLEEMWANLMLSLGLVKGALEIFIKLKLWEDVIVCYNMLELKHKSAEIIRQEISKKPTVRLWCLLGDATGDTNHYETAWELSGKKSSRAQRHWGFHCFAKKDYNNAILHLKLSVELNNIQENVWLRLGFAALQTENWKLAATAYRNYCALEQTTFEAWNNLAKAYIKLGDKHRAWKSLQDAIKCNYDRWEVWDNLMVVSIDLGHFSEVIRCYHRILDLKGQHLDIQILEIVTNAVVNNINDAHENPSRNLLQKTLELFGRITSIIPNIPSIWIFYAQLTALKQTEIDDQKVAQYLQQAYRSAVSDPRWYQTQESILNVLKLCHHLYQAYLHCSSNCTINRKRAMLGSAKLSLQGTIKKVKDMQLNNTDIITSVEQIEEYLKVISDELEEIKLKIEQ